MATLTKKTIRKLRCKAAEEFIPIGEDMRANGVDDHDILITFQKYRDSKRRQFYQKKGTYLNNLDKKILLSEVNKLKNADSIAEGIFYENKQGNSHPYYLMKPLLYLS